MEPLIVTKLMKIHLTKLCSVPKGNKVRKTVPTVFGASKKQINQFTNPVEVVDDPDFAVFVLDMILDVVLFHVRADVFFHRVIFVFELESALQR